MNCHTICRYRTHRQTDKWTLLELYYIAFLLFVRVVFVPAGCVFVNPSSYLIVDLYLFGVALFLTCRVFFVSSIHGVYSTDSDWNVNKIHFKFVLIQSAVSDKKYSDVNRTHTDTDSEVRISELRRNNELRASNSFDMSISTNNGIFYLWVIG